MAEEKLLPSVRNPRTPTEFRNMVASVSDDELAQIHRVYEGRLAERAGPIRPMAEFKAEEAARAQAEAMPPEAREAYDDRLHRQPQTAEGLPAADLVRTRSVGTLPPKGRVAPPPPVATESPQDSQSAMDRAAERVRHAEATRTAAREVLGQGRPEPPPPTEGDTRLARVKAAGGYLEEIDERSGVRRAYWLHRHIDPNTGSVFERAVEIAFRSSPVAEEPAAEAGGGGGSATGGREPGAP